MISVNIFPPCVLSLVVYICIYTEYTRHLCNLKNAYKFVVIQQTVMVIDTFKWFNNCVIVAFSGLTLH